MELFTGCITGQKLTRFQSKGFLSKGHEDWPMEQAAKMHRGTVIDSRGLKGALPLKGNQ